MPKNTHETIRESLYRAHYRQVYAFVDRFFADAGIATQLSEDVFADAFTNYGSFGIRTRSDMLRHEGEIRMLLARLCVKYALRELRDAPETWIRYDWYVTDPEAPLTEEPGYSLRGEVTAGELYRALTSLHGDGCELLLLRQCAELPMEWIASLYDISGQAALIRYLRARRSFMEKFRAAREDTARVCGQPTMDC